MNKLKKLITKILTFLKGIILAILYVIKEIFSPSKKKVEQKKDIQKNVEKQKEIKRVTEDNITTLPDEDNIKTNPHNDNITSTENNNDENTTNEVILELPQEKLYKIYNKDNELKYLTINSMLDLIVKEELEDIYKIEKFKFKEATDEQLKQVEEIKERILPIIIIEIKQETLRDSNTIRKEVRKALEDDLIEHPLFPPRKEETIDSKEHTAEKETTKKDDNIYSLAIPIKRDIKLKEEKVPEVKNTEPIVIVPELEPLEEKLENTNVAMVKTVDEIPNPTVTDTIKEAAMTGAIATAGIITELATPPKSDNETEKQKDEQPIEEIKTQEVTTPTIEQIKEEIKTEEATTKEELEELRQKIEEKIEEIKQEEKEQVKKEVEKELIKEATVVAIADTAEDIIYESKKEIDKEEFDDKDYDRIERQVDKMLEDISNTFLKYEDKMTDRQKKKLRTEEEKLRETKDIIAYRKEKDIEFEIGLLTDPIRESEIQGVKQELDSINQENEKEVSNNFLEKMDKLEGMTKEQVANIDKKMMFKRFNKINLLLEMTSLLALPFVRNRYFFYFTIGLIVDNHFNFINSFLGRKLDKYEPADLEQIKQGQDALNGALDITFKNIVELDYLETQALTKYPELAKDPHFISQVTNIRTQLNKKYNKLMKKNKTMEKYYHKTKHQTKILKKNKKNTSN